MKPDETVERIFRQLNMRTESMKKIKHSETEKDPSSFIGHTTDDYKERKSGIQRLTGSLLVSVIALLFIAAPHLSS